MTYPSHSRPVFDTGGYLPRMAPRTTARKEVSYVLDGTFEAVAVHVDGDGYVEVTRAGVPHALHLTVEDARGLSDALLACAADASSGAHR